MTTAHRPTFDPARGGSGRNEGDLSKLSVQYSSKDMPSHTTLKYRQKGQASNDEVRSKDFRRELEDRERPSGNRRRELASSSSGSSSKKARLEVTAANLDADDAGDNDDEDDDSDEDDTAELMAELSRIKKERAEEKAKHEESRKVEEERIRTENILHGNPLLAGKKQDFTVSRRWDDDVVFKNCAKGIDERAKEPTFINDAIRSEFHKKFMEKYIK